VRLRVFVESQKQYSVGPGAIRAGDRYARLSITVIPGELPSIAAKSFCIYNDEIISRTVVFLEWDSRECHVEVSLLRDDALEIPVAQHRHCLDRWRLSRGVSAETPICVSLPLISADTILSVCFAVRCICVPGPSSVSLCGDLSSTTVRS
jgi:hypothetical protein